MTNNNILGIDPSLNMTGWAVIQTNKSNVMYVDSGVVATSKLQDLHKRLALITTNIENTINLYKPSFVMMEETFINKNALSSLKLAYVRGAIMSVIGKYNLVLQHISANSVKKNITGFGHADKKQVLKMMQHLIINASKVEKFDEADALAIAYSGSLMI